MEFDIGDLVEIGGMDGFLEVSGVIHDDELVYCWIDGQECVFGFNQVERQYILKDNNNVG